MNATIGIIIIVILVIIIAIAAPGKDYLDD